MHTLLQCIVVIPRCLWVTQTKVIPDAQAGANFWERAQRGRGEMLVFISCQLVWLNIFNQGALGLFLKINTNLFQKMYQDNGPCLQCTTFGHFNSPLR